MQLKISKINLKKWLALFLIVVVQLLTIILLVSIDRFYVETQQLLKDPEFVQQGVFWQQDGNGSVQYNGKAVSIVSNVKTYQSIYQNIVIDEPGHYTVSFDAALTDVEVAAEKLGGAEVVVVFRTIDGRTNGGGKRIFLVSGTRTMASYGVTLRLGNDIGSVDIAARLKNASGSFTVSSPVVSRLKEFSFYKKIKGVLVLVWTVIFFGLAVMILKVFSKLQATVLVVVLGCALIGVLLPEGVMKSFSGVIASLLPSGLITLLGDLLARLIGYSNLSSGGEIVKIGHFAVFLVIGVIMGVNSRKIGIFFSLCAVASFAVLTEALQLLVVGRTPAVSDFLIDFSAGVIGLCVGLVMIFVGRIRMAN